MSFNSKKKKHEANKLSLERYQRYLSNGNLFVSKFYQNQEIYLFEICTYRPNFKQLYLLTRIDLGDNWIANRKISSISLQWQFICPLILSALKDIAVWIHFMLDRRLNWAAIIQGISCKYYDLGTL